eukprot:Protomagalhaensia_sp_Gyna_25__4618@NODE_426_length_3472_cov_21_979610_g327_i0_p1_GENE_NODE_426_length_3472_cov_21_979610_g327_i0NODE_426_length_3472_cov_21_979610_g327_i0_p1_ORF_typecomplete_len508_score71_72EMP24_GP25L/PF01105_24/3_5e16_NODE_426_length_3472_cov_21_979610_g327_i0521575
MRFCGIAVSSAVLLGSRAQQVPVNVGHIPSQGQPLNVVVNPINAAPKAAGGPVPVQPQQAMPIPGIKDQPAIQLQKQAPPQQPAQLQQQPAQLQQQPAQPQQQAQLQQQPHPQQPRAQPPVPPQVVPLSPGKPLVPQQPVPPQQQAVPKPQQPQMAQGIQAQGQPIMQQAVPVQAQVLAQGQAVPAQPVGQVPPIQQPPNVYVQGQGVPIQYAAPPNGKQQAPVNAHMIYPPQGPPNIPPGAQAQGNIPLYQMPPYMSGAGAIPQHMQPPLGQAVNASRAGPIAPGEMSLEQMRALEAAQGLYGAGEATVAGDTAAQWEALMADFVPDMIVTFKLQGGSTEHFHQEVGPQPTLIRGGFFESMTESGSAVSFTVISPSGKVAYMSRTGEGVFKFETKEAGQYTFAVHNSGWLGAKYVTFVVGAGVAEGLTQEDVDSLDGNVKMLYRMLYDMETQASYTWRRLKSHLEGMHSVASNTYYALLAQLAITGLATILQLHVIKRMVSHRRMF